MNDLKERNGLVQVYTGDGKGKTTSSIGLAIRAIGRNLKVSYVFFFKNFDTYPSGEIEVLKKLGINIFSFSPDTPLFNPEVKPETVRERCLNALDFIKNEIYKNNPPDLLVLDEINNAIPGCYLYEEEILELIGLKPEGMELVLTGRGASKNIIEAADLVSRIEKVRHPFDAGIKRRIGIEY